MHLVHVLLQLQVHAIGARAVTVALTPDLDIECFCLEKWMGACQGQSPSLCVGGN